MLSKLHTKTTSAALLHILSEISTWDELGAFRLVGGTALSLQLGHRVSVDIDLFTDAEYGSIDFVPIYNKLVKNYPVVIGNKPDNKGFGISYLVGHSAGELVKLDLFYCDPFIFPPVEIERIRMADIRDVVLMKLEVSSNGGRKKDFWDMSELLDHFSLDTMLELYHQKHPYFEVDSIVNQLTNFMYADDEPNPICLRAKYWEIIKLDLEEMVESRA